MQQWNTNIIEITSDYSTNGNKGLKITQNGTAKFIGVYFENISEYIGENLKFSADVSNISFDLRIVMMQYNGTSYNNSIAQIPKGSSNHAEVSATILDNTVRLWLRIEQSGTSWPTDGIFYTDNWELYVQS